MDIDNELEENETDVSVEEFSRQLGLEILHSCKSGTVQDRKSTRLNSSH